MFVTLCLVLYTVAHISTCCLYIYPYVKGCSFPTPSARQNSQSTNGSKLSQPFHFRLLLLGDPQLEGDSSLHDPVNGPFPSLQNLWSEIMIGTTREERSNILLSRWNDFIYDDIPTLFQFYRKRLDLFGNDYYLAHIYRTLSWSLHPTHVAVMGDLIGSQWVSDEEFERRGWRYWNRVFHGGRRVEDEITNGIRIEPVIEPVEHDTEWATRIINVAGNHDVGYAGDMTADKLQRFEKVFGKANWETRFDLSGLRVEEDQAAPELRLVVLNSLNLDPPVLEADLQGDTYKFMNDIIASSRSVGDNTSGTILLTHLPLHKEAGVCVDAPYFSYHDAKFGGGIREQNHLSQDTSKNILEGIYGMSGNPGAPAKGMGRNGIIITGHDHEGCDVYHHLPIAYDITARPWTAETYNSSSKTMKRPIPGIREITVRSMMGDFGGNAGLLSAWFDSNIQQWHFEYSTCALGTQHIWWAIHVLDIVTIVYLSVVGIVISKNRGKQDTQVAAKRKTL